MKGHMYQSNEQSKRLKLAPTTILALRNPLDLRLYFPKKTLLVRAFISKSSGSFGVGPLIIDIIRAFCRGDQVSGSLPRHYTRVYCSRVRIDASSFIEIRGSWLKIIHFQQILPDLLFIRQYLRLFFM